MCTLHTLVGRHKESCVTTRASQWTILPSVDGPLWSVLSEAGLPRVATQHGPYPAAAAVVLGHNRLWTGAAAVPSWTAGWQWHCWTATEQRLLSGTVTQTGQICRDEGSSHSEMELYTLSVEKELI